jgi:hypothetical protein
MKALFFLRHYNDIDHITPIVNKWVDAGHTCDVVLIGNGDFRTDYRIEYLSGLPGVRMATISEALPKLDFLIWKAQILLLARSLRSLAIGPLVERVTSWLGAERRKSTWLQSSTLLLDRTFGDSGEGVVAFDWIERNSVISVEWVEILVNQARERGLGTVSLPHGDSPHANQLIRKDELRVEPDTTFAAARMFDKLVVPNELCATRFRPFLDDSAIAVLGSPRYCDEWLEKLSELSPPTQLTRSDSKLKLVMFLRKSNFTTFWEEVALVVRMIVAFPGTELVVKEHTRGGRKQGLTKDQTLRNLPNVMMVGDNVHSVDLLDWADVIIDIATSVSFEAVKAGKPVLAADYLHAGRSTVAEYMPETALLCRDDVYNKVDALLTKGCDSFYVEENRQRFLDNMLDVGGPDVLPRYVDLLEEQAKFRS